MKNSKKAAKPVPQPARRSGNTKQHLAIAEAQRIRREAEQAATAKPVAKPEEAETQAEKAEPQLTKMQVAKAAFAARREEAARRTREVAAQNAERRSHLLE